MSDKIIENNQVTVIGEVVSEFTYSHEVFGEGFYMMELLVKRLSNSCDRIPVMISERLIDVIVACGYYAGGPAVQALLNVIPTWISNGLQITMGLLPAIGFGLLLMMIMEKDVACFFFLGFALSVYLKIPVTAIAIFGVIIAIVLTQLRSNSAQTAIEGGVDEDDDF